MTAPSVITGTSMKSKIAITPRTALISTLREWFLYRDRALWAFVGGTEADRPLEEIKVGDETLAHLNEANEAYHRAWGLAADIAKESEQKASTVMREAITELLASEAPQFLLSLSHIPGSF